MRRLTHVDAALVLTVLIWGANFAIVKAALREFHPLAFNLVRFALASLVIMSAVWWKERSIRVTGPDLLRIAALALVGNTIYQAFFIIGMSYTRAGDATLILAATPLATLLMTIAMRTEKIHLYSFAGVILALVGVVLVVYVAGGHVTADASNPLLGDLILVGCPISWAVYTVFSVPLLRRCGSLKFTALTMACGTVLMLPFAGASLGSQQWGTVSWNAWGGLVYSAIGSLVIGYGAWYYAVDRIGNSHTAVYSNLVPPFALLCAWVFLDEPLGWVHLLGMAVILLGVYITRKAPHPDAPETGG